MYEQVLSLGRPENLSSRKAIPRRPSFEELQEMRRMGVSEAELRNLIDRRSAFLNDRCSHFNIGDSAVKDLEVGFDRSGVRTNLNVHLQAMVEWRESLVDEKVLIAGSFPPPLIGQLLDMGINLYQIDAPDNYGLAPNHFYHLSTLGLRGVTKFSDIADLKFDVVVATGAKLGNAIFSSLLVALVSRLFPDARRQFLLAETPFPRMSFPMTSGTFECIPPFACC